MKKIIARIAYQEAKREANKGCPWFFYQQVMPEKVKKLKKK